MKVRITIEAEVADNVGLQMHRSGLAVIKSGSAWRLRVGDELVAKKDTVIKFTEPGDNHGGSNEK